MKAFLTAVADTKGIDPTLAEFAKAEIAKIDKKNADRKAKPTATQKANEDAVLEIVSGMSATDVLTAGALATAKGISTQKASALLQKGVKSGFLTACEVKVKGKGKVCGYAKANPTAEDVPAEGDSAEVVEGNSESAE
jgi:Fic family protein